MGLTISKASKMDPEVRPDFEKEPIFDPHYGYPAKRKPRQMIATEEELDNYNIPPSEWDYCSHLWIDFIRCRHEKFPFVIRCKAERDVHKHCQHEEWNHRAKEFERERRLLERAKRKRLAKEKEAAETSQ